MTAKPLDLVQLSSELEAAGCAVAALGHDGGRVHTYDADGVVADFTSEQQVIVDQVVAAHVAMRDKNEAEYAAEFQDGATTAARKQEIRDITMGLLPREKVPMEVVS